MVEDKDRIVKVKNGNEEVEIFIKNPTLDEREQADSVRLKKWNKALKDGAMLSENLNKFLKEQGIWTDVDEVKSFDLQTELLESVRALNKGGKLSEARKLAIRIRQIRGELQILSLPRIRYIDNCVEGQARNSEFNFLVSVTAVYNTDKNKRYFINHEDYVNRINDVDAFLIARKCSEVFYDNFDDSTLPENIFLKKYNFVNDDLSLINKNGHLIDADGNTINEFGEKVKEGNEVDYNFVEGDPVYIDDISEN